MFVNWNNMFMDNFEEQILKFDLMLSRHNNVSFTYYEIFDLLSNVVKDKIKQQKCLDFFVKHNILQKNDNNYYYLFDKCYRYNHYKNYTKIKSILESELCNSLDFSNLSF